jgi:hypothetical protein
MLGRQLSMVVRVRVRSDSSVSSPPLVDASTVNPDNLTRN